ncbi:MAG: sensor histidine kinase [Pyrinomonadaceae bacterium]
MRFLNLHIKTTVLASAITIMVLAATLALVSIRVADYVDKEQRDRAELLAINFADQLDHLPTPRDPQTLAQSATIMRGAHPDIVAVRVWERVGGVYKVAAEAAGSAPAEEFPEKTKDALRVGLDSSDVKSLPQNAGASLYRVFAPITETTAQSRIDGEERRFSGAVELVERLDDAPLIGRRFERTAIWMALAAIFITTLATYVLFRRIVYHPIERLLFAMSRAEAGDLNAQAPLRPPDEIGLLSRGFNRMIERIRLMTAEREARAEVLQERVHEATYALAQRNTQLEEINRELWQTTRRLTALERLAAAGQTAAQFAHEVGTPLNLISGHVQLLRAQLQTDSRAESRLETISAQIERIERIVRRMLDRTRPEAVALVPVDLYALLLRTFETTAPALESRNVQLDTTHLDPRLPFIKGDADRLQQVFINLINNALDAMPEGGRLLVSGGVARQFADEKEKSVVSSNLSNNQAQVDGGVFVEFADTGCGMGNDVRGQIFDPFYTTKPKGHGTGLGLFVVRQVLREHGGEIEVLSEKDCGARFRLKFPAIEIDDSTPADQTRAALHAAAR